MNHQSPQIRLLGSDLTDSISRNLCDAATELVRFEYSTVCDLAAKWVYLGRRIDRLDTNNNTAETFWLRKNYIQMMYAKSYPNPDFTSFHYWHETWTWINKPNAITGCSPCWTQSAPLLYAFTKCFATKMIRFDVKILKSKQINRNIFDFKICFNMYLISDWVWFSIIVLTL